MISQHRFSDYEARLFSSLRSVRLLVGAATHTPLRRSVVITPFTALRPEDDERSASSTASNQPSSRQRTLFRRVFAASDSTSNSRYFARLRAYINYRDGKMILQSLKVNYNVRIPVVRIQVVAFVLQKRCLRIACIDICLRNCVSSYWFFNTFIELTIVFKSYNTCGKK